MRFNTKNALSFLIFLSTNACSGKLNGADAQFLADPNLAKNVRALLSKGIKSFEQAPTQTLATSDGSLSESIKRIDPKASTFNQAFQKLTNGSHNALTDLTPGKNKIQKFINHYHTLYQQAISACGGFDPKDYGIDIDITEGVNPNPSSAIEINEALLNLLRNFFLKRKKLFSQTPSPATNTNLGSFIYLTLGWDFIFKNQENHWIPFKLSSGYSSFYTNQGYAGDPEKDLITLSDAVHLCFHTPKILGEDPLTQRFSSLLQKKEQALQDKFLEAKKNLWLQKKDFAQLSPEEKQKVIQKLRNEK